MEEIRIRTVDGAGAVEVESADRTKSEGLLEAALVANPDMLMPGLRLVGRQTPTEGGPLDILGVDDDGSLVVLELKRGTLSREAVAQVIDYAAWLDSLDEDALATHIAGNSGRHGIEEIENFRDWYLAHSGADDLESLRPIRMALVGLGVDARTERMVNFLAENSGLNISLLTFQGFQDRNRTLLARQVRVTQTKSKKGKKAKLQRLIERAEKYGVPQLFSEAAKTFRARWNGPLEHPTSLGLGFKLRDQPPPSRKHIYARIAPGEGLVRVVFPAKAVQLCPREFGDATKEIPFETWPTGRETDPFATPGTEIKFTATGADWQSHKDKIGGLASAVYDAVQRRLRDETAAGADVLDQGSDE